MNSIDSLNTIVNIEIDRIFVVTGNHSFKKIQKDFPILKKLSENATIFNQFSVNPKWEEVENGLNIFKKSTYDYIIAIGGGSVIDAAKIIKYHSKPNTSLKFIAIPTTAGSGSESTHFAVIYKKGVKSSISDYSILPDYVILDENVLKHQSLNQLSVSALDAFSQSIESIWSKGCNSKSFDFAIKGLEHSYLGLKSIISNNLDYGLLMKGSNYAGRAINISKTTAAHAISYYYTSKYGLTHGYSVAYTIPFFMVENYNHTNKCEVIESRYNKILDSLNVKSINEGALIIFELIIKLPLEKKLKDFDFSSITVNELKKNVNQERLNNNPCRVDFNALKNYLNNPKQWLKD